jgi:hypothetical protein
VNGHEVLQNIFPLRRQKITLWTLVEPPCPTYQLINETEHIQNKMKGKEVPQNFYFFNIDQNCNEEIKIFKLAQKNPTLIKDDTIQNWLFHIHKGNQGPIKAPTHQN